jgi:hypothetical protein
MNNKAPYCLNSRKWLDFEFYGMPKSCPYSGFQGASDCLYDRCGYYEEREINNYYKNKMRILKSYGGKDEEI